MDCLYFVDYFDNSSKGQETQAFNFPVVVTSIFLKYCDHNEINLVVGLTNKFVAYGFWRLLAYLLCQLFEFMSNSSVSKFVYNLPYNYLFPSTYHDLIARFFCLIH